MRGFVAIVAALTAGNAAAAGTVIWVDQQAGQTRTDCVFTSGPGSSAAEPLAAAGTSDGLAHALNCINTNTYAAPIEVRVLCSQPTNWTCDYTLDTAQQYNIAFNKDGTASSPNLLRAEPFGTVRIRRRTPVQFNGDYWRIEGFIFDGARDTVDRSTWSPTNPDGSINSTGTFLELRGDGILFQHNRVENTMGSCVFVGSTSDATVAPRDVTVAHNTIRRCYSFARLHEDHHAVFTHRADNLRVAFNDLYNVQGDGYQGVLNLRGYPQGLNGPTSASYTTVIGNRMWAGPVFDLELNQCVTPGENGLDIKRVGLGLKVQDNKAWGWRPTSGGATCPGTTEAVSVNEVGGAFVFHGQVEDDSAPPPTGENPTCTAAQATAGLCGIIEGNDIFHAQEGIGIGGNPTTGVARGYHVRGNFIHDLSVGLPNSSQPNAQGRGMNLQVDAALPADVLNYVYRNTLVNLPAGSIDMAGPGATIPGNHSKYFLLGNNLVAWTSTAYGHLTPYPANATCQGITSVSGDTPYSYGDFIFKGVSYNQGPSPNNGTASVVGQDPLFQTAYGVHPEHGDATAVASCGKPLNHAVSEVWRFAEMGRQHDMGTRIYDYRLASNSPAKDSAPTTALGMDKSHSDVPANCGAADYGAHEYCNPNAFWMRENKTGWGTDEDVSGTILYWESPDVGVVSEKSALETGFSPFLASDEAELKVQPLGWNDRARVLVRVRAGSVPAPTTLLRLRVFQGNPATTYNFPSDVERIVPDTTSRSEFLEVRWDGTGPGSGTAWGLAPDPTPSDTERIFWVPWTPKSFKPEQIHSFFRVEIGADNDPRPPFWTFVTHSNNLALRSFQIMAGMTPFTGFGAQINGLRPTPDAIENRRISVSKQFEFPRTAYLYIPNEGEPDKYVDDDTQPFPPMRGQLIALAPTGPDDVELRIPSQTGTFVQFLVDLRERPLLPGERVTIRDDYGGTTLAPPPLFYESFEWGIPVDWSAEGMWRATDRYRDPGRCRAAALGRKAAAFNNVVRECTYAGFVGIASLRTPELTPSKVGHARQLRFRHFSETERVGGFEQRRLEVIVNGRVKVIKEWISGQDTGSFGNWQEEVVDVTDFLDAVRNGARVQFQFTFDARDSLFNEYRGWYIDDVGVE